VLKGFTLVLLFCGTLRGQNADPQQQEDWCGLLSAVGQQILQNPGSRRIEGSFDPFWVRYAKQDAS
jgi:hypothetical protein